MVVRDNFIHMTSEHEYFGLDNLKYEPMSKMIKHIQEPFNAEEISKVMAVNQLRKGGIETPTEEEVRAIQDDILLSWSKKAEAAQDHGTALHKVKENLHNGKPIDELDQKYHNILIKINRYLNYNKVYKSFSEFVVHSKRYRVAGTMDELHIRVKSSKSPIDIFDYKSNLKGFRLDSAKRDDETQQLIKHYNRYFLYPFEWIEASDYTKACFQLSGYALMLQEMFPSVRIGRLTIINVLPDLSDFNIYPIPYMKDYAEKLLELNLSKKKISKDPSAIKEEMNFENGYDF